MNAPETWLLLFGIGLVAGLRALTPPAAVSWAARLGWLNLHGTPFAFLGSTIAVALFTLGAAGELVTDQLPSTPARTVPVQFGARIVTGGFSAAALALSAGQSLFLGIALGILGAVAGTLGGYHARRGLVKGWKVPDFTIAVPEDIVAVSLGLFIASRF
ncbi:MAG: DUF4126 family protein [Candidatus Acidiferrales bacterium]|jgi:uncharacterized membrane protein